MYINVITASCRVENLSTVLESILISMENTDALVKWVIVIDGIEDKKVKHQLEVLEFISAGRVEIIPVFYEDKQSTAGNSQKNRGILEVTEGWVYFLDDDTIMHSNFIKTINNVSNEEFDLILISQERSPEEFPYVNVLEPNLDDIGIGKIDNGQAIFKRKVLENDGFYPIDFYQADGNLIKRACNSVPRERIKVYKQILCYYNKLV